MSVSIRAVCIASSVRQRRAEEAASPIRSLHRILLRGSEGRQISNAGERSFAGRDPGVQV